MYIYSGVKVGSTFVVAHFFTKSGLNSTRIPCLCFKILSGILYVHVHGNLFLRGLHWNAHIGITGCLNLILRKAFISNENACQGKIYFINLSL